MIKARAVFLMAVALGLVPADSGAQCGSLPTLYTGGAYCTNGGGPMFDVVALNPAGVHVTGFDVNLNAGTHTISVYAITGGGSFVGSELSAGAWTLVGTATAVSTGPGVATAVPLAFDVFVAGGGVQGFHVRAGAGGLRYSSGSAVGAVLAANADLQVLEGKSQCASAAGALPFTGSVPSPRVFNGTVTYNQDFQINTPGASLDIDGVQGGACSPAVVTKAQGATAVLNLSSTSIGMGFEAVLAFAPLVPAWSGGQITANGQILNMDFGASVLVFLIGGNVPSFIVPFPGSLSTSFTTPLSSVIASIQMVILEPSHPDGFVLSQGGQLNVF